MDYIDDGITFEAKMGDGSKAGNDLEFAKPIF